MSANLYEEIAAEYLSVSKKGVNDPEAKDFSEELASEMVSLANLALKQ